MEPINSEDELFRQSEILKVIVGNTNAKLLMGGEDYVQHFLRLTEDEKVAVVKEDMSICIKSLGYYVSRTSMKQLAKDFGTPERYKLICEYEDKYESILKALLKK